MDEDRVGAPAPFAHEPRAGPQGDRRRGFGRAAARRTGGGLLPVVFVPDSKYCSRGTDFTIECAKKYGKPYCIIHYLDRGAIMGLKNMISQLGDEQSLNIAGPRESEHSGAYDLCLAIAGEPGRITRQFHRFEIRLIFALPRQ